MATLTGAWAVNAPAATNVAQIVISGTTRYAPAGALSLPAFGSSHSGAEIAAVANFVTGRFGSNGSNIAENDVASLRKQAGQQTAAPSKSFYPGEFEMCPQPDIPWFSEFRRTRACGIEPLFIAFDAGNAGQGGYAQSLLLRIARLWYAQPGQNGMPKLERYDRQRNILGSRGFPVW